MGTTRDGRRAARCRPTRRMQQTGSFGRSPSAPSLLSPQLIRETLYRPTCSSRASPIMSDFTCPHCAAPGRWGGNPLVVTCAHCRQEIASTYNPPSPALAPELEGEVAAFARLDSGSAFDLVRIVRSHIPDAQGTSSSELLSEARARGRVFLGIFSRVEVVAWCRAAPGGLIFDGDPIDAAPSDVVRDWKPKIEP